MSRTLKAKDEQVSPPRVVEGTRMDMMSLGVHRGTVGWSTGEQGRCSYCGSLHSPQECSGDVTEAFTSPDICRESQLPESSASAPCDLTDDFRRSRKQGGGWILWIQL